MCELSKPELILHEPRTNVKNCRRFVTLGQIMPEVFAELLRAWIRNEEKIIVEKIHHESLSEPDDARPVVEVIVA